MTNKQTEAFGLMPDGREVTACTLRTDRAEVEILTLGGIIRRFVVGGTDIVAGFDSVADYLADNSYQGAIIGRTCNRIRDARYEWNGRAYQLSRNEGQNQLHGGGSGWNRKLWQIIRMDESSLTLTLRSPDGEEGYPGNVDAEVTYTLRDSTLLLTYEAKADRDTPVSMTCHAYFNLLGYGSGDILGHRLRIDADTRTEVDAELIPTGQRIPVEGTCFDFRAEKPIGADWPQDFGGFDDNFMLNGTERHSVLGHDLAFAASLSAGGKTLSVYTDRPALQLYIGNALTGKTAMKGGRPQQRHCTCCLETQTEPDLATRRGETILRPGEVYRTCTAYRVDCDN